MTNTDVEFQMESFECAWDAICKTPHEANELRARSDIMMAIENITKENAWKPAEAARLCGIPLSRMRRFLKHGFNDFSLTDLLDMAACLGYRPNVTLQKRRAL
jgi:predicted XRE-type DNA-binding protein